MTLTDFIQKHRHAGTDIQTLATRGIEELYRKTNSNERRKPTHLPDQRNLIQGLFESDSEIWLFFFDAGRYDLFDMLVWDYFDGNLDRVWNGGVGYTGDWAMRNLRMDFGNRGLFSAVPMRELDAVEYNDREYFAIAPDIHAEQSVKNRLAHLGYAEYEEPTQTYISPKAINEAVLENMDNLNGGVIRYLKPHPPFDGLEDLTSESTKTTQTRQALKNGDLTYNELTQAYIDTYRVAFEYAKELIPQLSGKVIITADHGTCLTCGQLFHGRNLAKHDHLTVVPWFGVDRIL